MSGFGLSAFWFSLLAHTFFPGDTSALLLTLALVTAISMFMGLFMVKPVPPSSYVNNFIPDADSIVFVRETQTVMNPEAVAEAATDCTPLLRHEQEFTSYRVVLSPSVVELNPPEALHCERGVGDNDPLPDIHGKQLWLTPDFYLVLVIMAICEWPVQKLRLDA